MTLNSRNDTLFYLSHPGAINPDLGPNVYINIKQGIFHKLDVSFVHFTVNISAPMNEKTQKWKSWMLQLPLQSTPSYLH